MSEDDIDRHLSSLYEHLYCLTNAQRKLHATLEERKTGHSSIEKQLARITESIVQLEEEERVGKNTALIRVVRVLTV